MTGVRPFGVFVDLEGVTGLLHIKQVSQKFIENLPGIFETGQELKAVIIEIDDVKKRISLSTRILESYPGEMLEKREEIMATAEARLPKAQQKLFGTAPVVEAVTEPAPVVDIAESVPVEKVTEPAVPEPVAVPEVVAIPEVVAASEEPVAIDEASEPPLDTIPEATPLEV